MNRKKVQGLIVYYLLFVYKGDPDPGEDVTKRNFPAVCKPVLLYKINKKSL